jgi:hypothetical protein
MTCSHRVCIVSSEEKGKNTDVIAILAVQVVVAFERDMRIRNDPGISQMVGRVTVWEKLMRNEQVSFFTDNRSELFAVFHMRDQFIKWVIKAFRMIVQIFSDT